jgi:hypothetical protein
MRMVDTGFSLFSYAEPRSRQPLASPPEPLPPDAYRNAMGGYGL